MDEDDVDRLRLEAEASIGDSWSASVDHLRTTNTVADIEARLEQGLGADSVKGLDAAAGRVAASITAEHTRAGEAAAAWLDDAKPAALITYDATNPRAADWAASNRAELVREVTQQQRQVIAQTVGRGVMAGTNPREIARDIRDSIGLTAHQEAHVANYRRALESGDLANALGRELRDGRSDRSLRAAMRDNTAISPAQVDSMTERYRANYVAHRGEVIARTEALRAVHQGTDELYAQAIESGDVEADELEQEWHSSGKKDHREAHTVVVGPDGKRTKAIGELWTTGNGNHLRYPGDPDASASETIHCACCVSTRIRPNHRPLADAPAGFDPRGSTVRAGIPPADEIRPNAVYRVPIAELEADLRALPGGGDDEVRMQSIRNAWDDGKTLAPVRLVMTPKGKYFVDDGRHRLLVAIERGIDVLVLFSAALTDDILAHTVRLVAKSPR